MSEHTSGAITAAHENVTSAVWSARRHRHRAGTVRDLESLVQVVATIGLLTTELGELVGTVADDLRTHYLHGTNPTGTPWPGPLRDAAGDADRALIRLRLHLARRGAVLAGHDALSVLHGFLRDLHRAEERRTA